MCNAGEKQRTTGFLQRSGRESDILFFLGLNPRERRFGRYQGKKRIFYVSVIGVGKLLVVGGREGLKVLQNNAPTTAKKRERDSFSVMNSKKREKRRAASNPVPVSGEWEKRGRQ